MTWKGFTIAGDFYDLSHLQSTSHEIEVDGNSVQLHVSYANHCFTDEKENGPMLFRHEGRYWCHDRYQRSKELPSLIKNKPSSH